MRYIKITHSYIIPVPASEQDVIEPLAREGMSIMEGFMSARAQNMTDLRSDWQLLPKEYRPEQPVSTLDEGPHVVHPWDQGTRIMPRDHELFAAETVALEQEGKLCGWRDGTKICVGVRGHSGDHMWEEDHGSVGGDTAGSVEGGQGSIEAGPDGD